MSDSDPVNDAEHTATSVLRRVSPGWAWARENFKLPSVLTIVGILGAGGSYIVSLAFENYALRTRVATLETEVSHIVAVAPDQANTLARIREETDDHERRLARLEDNWDNAERQAGTPPRVRQRKGR